ncbi:hypothetical protein ACFLSY_09965 [Bacteroidota bacterium]
MKDDEPKYLLSELYKPSIDYVTGLNAQVATVNNQFLHLNEENKYGTFVADLKTTQEHLFGLDSVQAYLPNVKDYGINTEFHAIARESTNSLVSVNESLAINGAINTETNFLSTWYDKNKNNPEVISIDNNNWLSTKYATGIIEPHVEIGALSSYNLQASLVKATELNLYAEKSVIAVNDNNIGSLYGLDMDSKVSLGAAYTDFSKGYLDLNKSFLDDPISYSKLNPSIYSCVPTEYYLGTNILETISIPAELDEAEKEINNDIKEENENIISEYLPQIDDGLYKMWQGAIQAFYSDNPDRVRHFSASIRELFTHIMHNLASDEDIMEWSKDSSLYHEKRPTRKARLMYICRNVSHEPLKKFVKKDVDSTIEFINIFQRGTHEIEANFSESQLELMKNKAESIIKFILEINYKSN